MIHDKRRRLRKWTGKTKRILCPKCHTMFDLPEPLQDELERSKATLRDFRKEPYFVSCSCGAEIKIVCTFPKGRINITRVSGMTEGSFFQAICRSACAPEDESTARF